MNYLLIGARLEWKGQQGHLNPHLKKGEIFFGSIQESLSSRPIFSMFWWFIVEIGLSFAVGESTVSQQLRKREKRLHHRYQVPNGLSGQNAINEFWILLFWALIPHLLSEGFNDHSLCHVSWSSISYFIWTLTALYFLGLSWAVRGEETKKCAYAYYTPDIVCILFTVS